MTLIVPNAGEAAIAAAALGKTAMTALTLRLYSNNYTPTEASVGGDFVEVVGGGYAAIALVAANWNVTPGAPTVADYAEQVFNFNGDAPDAYGYYVTRADGTVIWAERFPDPVPVVVANNGDQIKVTPRIEFD